MKCDLRDTALFREAEGLFETLTAAGSGLISDAAALHGSPDGRAVVFAGTIVATLEGTPPTRICRLDLEGGRFEILTDGPNTDRLPKFAPDGRQIAFLSDRHQVGDFQLYLLDLQTETTRPVPRVDGWIEYLHWSPDGRRILLGVAGHGADVAGIQGAITSANALEELPAWMPKIDTGAAPYEWRRAWVYELSTDRVSCVGGTGTNVWEATWCGNNAIAAVVSPGPAEGLWYGAHLERIELDTGRHRELFRPKDQIGWAAGSPCGKRLAFVEAVCSDRGFVAGDLKIIDLASGQITEIDTRQVDVSCIEWRPDDSLLLAGHRGFETVVGRYSVKTKTFIELWASRQMSSAGSLATVTGIGTAGDCMLVSESYTRSAEIGLIREGQYSVVKSFDVGYAELAKSIASIECLTWNAGDGIEIQGWLLRPQGHGPFPLLLSIHGGPVWNWHPFSLSRGRYVSFLMLLQHGYAVFFPNPRGSSGRGQSFARSVVGDLGGADAADLLSGVDHLIKHGIADPRRLGVTGVSYGGFMTSWLITQDSRFAAAVPISPHTNQVTQHLLSNIPQFMTLFLEKHYDNPGGKYFERSPIMHARNARTPTLNICGALDRCTPPEEAMQFHQALRAQGIESTLAIYPKEGHGIRQLPAAIDASVRIVAWFDRYLR